MGHEGASSRDICILYKELQQALGLRAPIASESLASAGKIRITRASAVSGRELNGRSQQNHRFGDLDVAGPVGPSSRVPAF